MICIAAETGVRAAVGENASIPFDQSDLTIQQHCGAKQFPYDEVHPGWAFAPSSAQKATVWLTEKFVSFRVVIICCGLRIPVNGCCRETCLWDLVLISVALQTSPTSQRSLLSTTLRSYLCLGLAILTWPRLCPIIWSTSQLKQTVMTCISIAMIYRHSIVFWGYCW